MPGTILSTSMTISGNVEPVEGLILFEWKPYSL